MSDIIPGGYTPKTDWTDDDYAIFEQWIRGVLFTDVTEVTFTKKDGTERVMLCTLSPKFLPVVALTEGTEKKERVSAPEHIKVFDMTKQEWRSFKIRSVKSVKFSIGGSLTPSELDNRDWSVSFFPEGKVEFPSGKKP